MNILGRPLRRSTFDDLELGYLRRGFRYQPTVQNMNLPGSYENTKSFGLNTGTDESAEGWLEASERLREDDIRKYRGMGEDVDTVLVVAALFSAIVSTFGVDRYKTLFPDPTDEQTDLLRTISLQLSGVNISANSVNPAANFHQSVSDTATTVLWFSSLVFSLVAASLGMLLKQWFREYLAENSTAPMERCRVRFFRNQGIIAWKMEEIASFLPLLIQIAILLFLAGLAVFTLSIDPILGAIITTLIGLWAIIFFFANISPIFSTNCPYKSPFLKGPLQYLRGPTRLALCRLFDIMHAILRTPEATSLAMPVPTEDEMRKDTTQDLDVLVDIHRIFVDNRMLKTTADCIISSKTPYTIESIKQCWDRIAGLRNFGGYLDLASAPYGRPIRSTFRYFMILALDQQLKWQPWMTEMASSEWFSQFQSEEPHWDGYLAFMSELLNQRRTESLLEIIPSLYHEQNEQSYRFSCTWIRPRLWKAIRAGLTKETSWTPWVDAMFVDELNNAVKQENHSMVVDVLRSLIEYGDPCVAPAISKILRHESKVKEDVGVRTAMLDLLQAYAEPTSPHCRWQPWMKDILSNEILLVPLDPNDAFESAPHLDATIQRLWSSGNALMSGNATWSCFAEEGLRGITYFPVAYVRYESDMIANFIRGLVHTVPDRQRPLSTHLRILFFTLKLVSGASMETLIEQTPLIKRLVDVFVDFCPVIPRNTRRADSVLHEYMRRSLTELKAINENVDGLINRKMESMIERGMAFYSEGGPMPYSDDEDSRSRRSFPGRYPPPRTPSPDGRVSPGPPKRLLLGWDDNHSRRSSLNNDARSKKSHPDNDAHSKTSHRDDDDARSKKLHPDNDDAHSTRSKRGSDVRSTRSRRDSDTHSRKSLQGDDSRSRKSHSDDDDVGPKQSHAPDDDDDHSKKSLPNNRETTNNHKPSSNHELTNNHELLNNHDPPNNHDAQSRRTPSVD